MIDNFLLIVSVFGGVATILGGIYKTVKMFHNVMNKIEDVEKQIQNNALHILKLAILEENMPMVERIKCGEQYVSMGGNGQIKKIYERLVRENHIMNETFKKNKKLAELSDEQLDILLSQLNNKE